MLCYVVLHLAVQVSPKADSGQMHAHRLFQPALGTQESAQKRARVAWRRSVHDQREGDEEEFLMSSDCLGEYFSFGICGLPES